MRFARRRRGHRLAEAWLDFLGRPQVTIDSEWIARVEGDHLTSLTRAGLS